MYGDVNIGLDNDTEIYPSDDFGITSSPVKLNRSDSILDIHTTVDFGEADMHESDSETATANQSSDAIFAPMPEPSKWEREEETGVEKGKNLLLYP